MVCVQSLLGECAFLHVQFQAGDVGPRAGSEGEVSPKGRVQKSFHLE